METDEERKTRLEKMVATAQLMLALIKGVVDVGVVLSLKPILATMLIIQTTERNIDHELLSASLILYVPNSLYLIILIYHFTLSLIKLTITIHICMYVCI